MYSVVLLMAISGGAEAPAGLFHHGHGGCSGYAGCDGCAGGAGCAGSAYTGCAGGAGCTGGGCHGGGHHFLGGHGGCHGGGGGCHGGGGLFHHGRSRGCHGGGGCQGVAYSGCYGGCYGGAGCTGGVVVPAPTTGPKEMPKPGDKPKEETSLLAPATIIVSMPADAKLTIDDAATTSMGAVRTFVSPTLNSGVEYHYTLRTEIAGKSIAKQITVRAGEETRIELSSADVAQK
ncbi:MAG TPA: TIGR03000 domain-containing protein [Gemmataceae bacterium]